MIKIQTSSGDWKTVRALIDSASQHSLVSEECIKSLDLPTKKTTHKLIGINETVAETSLYSANLVFTSYFSNETFNVNALVVKKVTTSLPNFILKVNKWPHTECLTLADPSFFIENDIHVLIGADLFISLITGPPIIGPEGTPSALPTKLGYLLSGIVNTESRQNTSLINHMTTVIEDNLKLFWELESIPPKLSPLNDEDVRCDNIFENSVSRNAEGRYVVKLPFKESTPDLGDSSKGALARFYALERKLNNDDNLKQKYCEFMKEYIELNHMALVPDNITPSYFLPHHGVLNESSTTTKLRVVFDGSFKSTNGNSLNDVLLTGKKLQTDIFDILLKFRLFPVAFSADITKMYRQILIADEDLAYQCIFWRESPNDQLKTYMLKTVTYGTVSAPYLAIRTIKQLCEDEKAKFPQAAKLAKEHFYVDDLLAGADSLESAKIIIQELINFMNTGGFELRKWACSHPEALSGLPEALTADNFSHSFPENSSQKVLGLFWDLKSDVFQVRAISAEIISTKRQLLSVIARIFDPLGFVAPSVILLKIMLQDVWKENLEWDENLPTDILNRWAKFQAEISYFKDITIPRYIDTLQSYNFEIHGFCDSSAKAYAAVVYIRILSDSPQTFLVAAKTRVAPVRAETLPRLELCGALLLAELVNKLKETIKFKFENLYLWSDSTITLNWINNPPIKGNQFVHHRVTKILSLTTTENWHHIPGKYNIADCASRGLYPKQLLDHSEWFNGPKWLSDFEPHSLLIHSPIIDYADIPQDNQISSLITTSLNHQPVDFSDIIHKFSSYLKLIRTVAYVFRFYHNLKNDIKNKGPLHAQELNLATKVIVKLIQNQAFCHELQLLKNCKSLPKNSKLLSLNPFIDQEGILRVGGRLRHQHELSFDQKFPILIPKSHHLTSLIIRHYHITNLHAGQDLTLSLIRNTFWIPDGKSAVRKEIRKCLTCIKFNSKPITQIMGDLPPHRVNPCRAFERVGVDFAGPLNTKCQHLRKPTIFKSYICLFICMCTKAIHLELVSSLSSSAFLAAFRRFVARRGYPSDVYSDNGRNFVGASAHLKSLFKLPRDEAIQNYSTEKNIRWHFIPPYSPNFGGLWESAIKLTKTHLHKICTSALLNFEEMNTLLHQIEACLNSRPLHPMSTESTDFDVLTPGHFLIGGPLLQIPDHSTNHICMSSISRWTLIQKLKQQFWNRWSTAYLQSLQQRQKWKRNHTTLKPGMIILLKEPTSQASHWTLGQIEAIRPGADGVVRVVQVRTAKGIQTRPVSQVILLPVDDAASTMPPPAVC